MNLKEYQNLKDRMETLQRDADRLQGSLDQLKSQLETEFNCKSVKEAEKLLNKLEGEEAESTREFDKKVREFHKKWGDKL